VAESTPPIYKNLFEKYAQSMTVAAVVLVAALILYSGIRLARGRKEPVSKRPVSAENRVTELEPVKPPPPRVSTKKPDTPKPPPPKPRAAKSIVVPPNAPLILKAETVDKVWLRVKSDGGVIFESTLSKGSSKVWKAEDELELWVGRGDALRLTLNDYYIGSPGSGSIRSVILNREGMKVRKK
jgi:hypothetical protein